MDLPVMKSMMHRSNIISYLDDCNRHVIRRACEIGVEGTSTDENQHLNESFHHVATSTPNVTRFGMRDGNGSKAKLADRTTQKSIGNDDSPALSVSKVLYILETKRKEEVQETIEKLKAELTAKEDEMLKKATAYQESLQAQSQAKALKVQEEQLRQLREEEALAAECKQRQELQQQRHAQRVSMRHEQIKAAEHQKKEAETERKRKTAITLQYIQEIQKHWTQFSETYKKIHHELQSSHNVQSLSPFLTQLRPLHNDMQSVIQHVKDVDINQDDVNAAKTLCEKLCSMYSSIQEHIAKINKQADEKESEKQQHQSEVQLLPQSSHQANQQESNTVSNIVINTSSANELSDCVDNDSLQRFKHLKEFKENNEKLFEHLIKDNSLKKYRFDCQKAVNIPVNAISPVSASHLRDKLQKLSLLLSGQPVTIGDGARVSASQHPAGIPFCKDLLAKKFVRQGAQTVSSKPEAAYAIAAVIVALWQDFPDWGQLLLAHFHQECPYLVPVFWPQLEGQSNKDYYISLGYTYNENGEVEKQDKFLKRMSGMMRLYAAILITRLRRDRHNQPHPHDLGQGWRWLTSLLNLEPRPDICATVLYDFLEVAGSSMLEKYGRQYQKLLLVICKEYFPRLRKIAVSSGGPVVRLETFLQTVLRQGSRPPQGMLPLNFW